MSLTLTSAWTLSALQDSAVQAMGGVSAFSRQRERMRQLDAAEVAAMEELLADPQFEDAEGDLEDDFVLAATQVGFWHMVLI